MHLRTWGSGWLHSSVVGQSASWTGTNLLWCLQYYYKILEKIRSVQTFDMLVDTSVFMKLMFNCPAFINYKTVLHFLTKSIRCAQCNREKQTRRALPVYQCVQQVITHTPPNISDIERQSTNIAFTLQPYEVHLLCQYKFKCYNLLKLHIVEHAVKYRKVCLGKVAFYGTCVRDIIVSISGQKWGCKAPCHSLNPVGLVTMYPQPTERALRSLTRRDVSRQSDDEPLSVIECPHLENSNTHTLSLTPLSHICQNTAHPLCTPSRKCIIT